MKKVICSMIVLLSVFIYGFAMAAVSPYPAPPTSVTVVNTSSNPVPVTGNLSE